MSRTNENEKPRVQLKGQNRVIEFRRIGEELTSKISKEKNVVGILLLGGLVRGFADKFSDLDITVFLGKKDPALCRKIRNSGSQMAKSHNVDLDLMIHYLDDFKKWKMRDEALRWEYSNAKIILDTTREVKRTLRNKLRPPRDFWIRRIAVCCEYLKWYCCPTEEGVGTISESWVERGDLASAHYSLSYSVDLLLRLLFAVNREFVPAPKWRIFYSRYLKWLPSDCRELIRESMTTRSLSLEDFNRRLTAIRKLWSGLTERIEEDNGLNPKTISKYYAEKVLMQT